MKQIHDISATGMCFFREKVSKDWILDLRKESDISFLKHYEIQIKNNVENPNRWLALNAIGDANLYLKFVEHLVLDTEIEKFLTEFFEGSFILNSFSLLNAKCGDKNFSSRHHRDSKYFSNRMNLMINFLVFLDDFTEENGATHVLINSHHKKEKPTDDFFFQNAVRATGKTGDILLFHSDVWHAAGLNLTQMPRRGIALTFTKPFIKQLVDIPRMTGEECLEDLDQRMRKILGFTSRVPANLNEWYQPLASRFYSSE